MSTERTLHLITNDVRGLTGLLDIHSKLNNIQEELKRVLVLSISPLNGKRKEWLTFF